LNPSQGRQAPKAGCSSGGAWRSASDNGLLGLQSFCTSDMAGYRPRLEPRRPWRIGGFQGLQLRRIALPPGMQEDVHLVAREEGEQAVTSEAPGAGLAAQAHGDAHLRAQVQEIRPELG
jgi:hypothetical protein